MFCNENKKRKSLKENGHFSFYSFFFCLLKYNFEHLKKRKGDIFASIKVNRISLFIESDSGRNKKKQVSDVYIQKRFDFFLLFVNRTTNLRIIRRTKKNKHFVELFECSTLTYIHAHTFDMYVNKR